MRKLIVIVLVVLIPCSVLSQKKKKKGYLATDSIAMIKELMDICNRYKQLPLQVKVKLLQETNMLTDAEDTTTVEASFFLNDEGSYIRFGELEQLVNDSIMVLVSHELKQIIVYANNLSVQKQMQQYLGIQLKDSTYEAIAKRFICGVHNQAKDTAEAELTSRNRIVKVGLPKETVTARYHRETKELFDIVQVNRMLVAITEEQYRALQNDILFAGKVMESEGEYYVVKEKKSVFRYQPIEYNTLHRLPVVVRDRIVRDKKGGFVGVNEYAKYSVVVAD